MNTLPEYNGWANYPTWCVNLWLSNDERSYYEAHDLPEPADVQQLVEDMLLPETSGMGHDLMQWTLAHVDWEHIHRGFRD